MIKTISQKRIQNYRSLTFRIRANNKVKTRNEAVEFVNQRGFIFFWPINDIVMPSLWTAVAGDRPVADAHDDPGHVTWGWKDSLLGSHQWYYAKVLRKRATMIAMNIAPYFYALTENYGSVEEDYLTQYEQGRLTQEAKAVYDALLNDGPLDTIALRRAARLTSRESDSRFNRALADLQQDFKILPIGVTQSGGWRYAFLYDIVARYYPELPEQARFIDEQKAKNKLAELYFNSVGAAQIRDLIKLFRWKKLSVEHALDQLIQSGVIYKDVQVENHTGEWFALRELCEQVRSRSLNESY